jgi:TPR repeat protein
LPVNPKYSHKAFYQHFMPVTILLASTLLAGCDFSINFPVADKEVALKEPKFQDMTIQELLPLAQKGNQEAQYHLASNFEARYFFSNAFKWYRLAAEKGHVDAQSNLAYLYYFGMGVKADQALAVRWFSRAAQKGDSYAQYCLGLLMKDGEGTTKDPMKAFQWFAKSAGQGNSFAQFEMANMYVSGDGVEKDMDKAIKWYGRSADQDNVEAQNILGAILYEGDGVKTDYVRAGNLFKKASQQGDASAQSNLSGYYLEAKAEPIDTVLAYAWFAIALETDKEVVDGELSDIATLMTESQIDEARRLADAWRPGQLLSRE